MTDAPKTFSDLVKNPPPQYATFNTRMMAVTIELGVLMILILPIIEWLMDKVFNPITPEGMMDVMSNWQAKHDAEQLISGLWGFVRTQHVLERMFVENTLQVLLLALYILPFWFRYSATPGKMLFRAEIRDATTGERMSRRQCVIRFLGYIVSGIPLTLGFIWIMFNKKRRGWHDMIANTVVVIKPKKSKIKDEV